MNYLAGPEQMEFLQINKFCFMIEKGIRTINKQSILFIEDQ